MNSVPPLDGPHAVPAPPAPLRPVGALPAARWINFLRKFGPIPTNDNMYDEVIQRSMARGRITPIKLPELYLDALLDNFRSPGPQSAILTGTAGDGKTYHCRRVWLELGGSEAEWNLGHKVQRLNTGAYELVVVKDLSELASGESDQILTQLAADLVGQRTDRLYLVAANHGQLLEKWKAAGSSPDARRVASAVEELLFDGGPSEATIPLRLYNFSEQSGAEMLPRIFEAVLQHPAWTQCGECVLRTSGAGCPIWENRARLLGGDDDALFLRRLVALLELAEQNGAHFPVRELLLLTSNLLLGHPDVPEDLLTCKRVGEVQARGTESRASPYRNAFGENLTPRGREGFDIFRELERFGIGSETSNRVDSVLVYGGDDPDFRPLYDQLLLADPLYGGTASYQEARRSYLEGEEKAGLGFLDALRAQRQRLFFTLPERLADALALWNLTVYRHAGAYLEVVRQVKSGGSPPRAVLPLLIRGLNRIFTGMLARNQDELVLATSGSHSQSKTSRLLDGTISVPRERGEEVSLVPHGRGVALSVQMTRDPALPPVVLPLTLLRFEFLCRVAEGALPSSFSLECYEDLLAFKAKLLRALEQRRQIDGELAVPGDDLVLRFVEVAPDGRVTPRRVEVYVG